MKYIFTKLLVDFFTVCLSRKHSSNNAEKHYKEEKFKESRSTNLKSLLNSKNVIWQEKKYNIINYDYIRQKNISCVFLFQQILFCWWPYVIYFECLIKNNASCKLISAFGFLDSKSISCMWLISSEIWLIKHMLLLLFEILGKNNFKKRKL